MTKAIYPDDKRKLVEDALNRFFPAQDRYPEIIYKAMRHSLFSGGKRFRSVLCLLVGEAFGAKTEDILPTACGLEYIHTYSLIHDDLPAIDNDDLRRGKPTCHVLFGEDIAILAGDALFAEAFYLVTSSRTKVEAERILEVVKELSYASGVRGMVSGQVADLQSADKQVKADILNFIHERKTGELITSAARAGAIIGNASSQRMEKVTKYAHKLGLAFQITDDILDVVGETDLLGKEVGSDERHNKATFPSIFGLDEAKRKAKEAIDSAINTLSGIEIDTSSLVDLAWFVYEREH